MMWKFLIENGSVSERDYYGGGCDDVATEKWREYVQLPSWIDLIDWDKTGDIKDDSYSTFEGTFCDAGSVEVMEGTMVCLNGEELRWELELEGHTVVSLIQKILEANNQ
jgi:hypothetical protein